MQAGQDFYNGVQASKNACTHALCYGKRLMVLAAASCYGKRLMVLAAAELMKGPPVVWQHASIADVAEEDVRAYFEPAEYQLKL